MVRTSFHSKSICVPLARPVDVSELLPILDAPPVQRLRHRKQLGVNHLMFPGAVHTRFEHSIGTLDLVQRVCERQKLPEDRARALQAYALLHDVGHGPFSHQIEPLLTKSHKENGLELVLGMRKAVHACGIEMEALVALMRRVDPLCAVVDDRNLGADKLDYLRRDSLHIGFSGTPDVEVIVANLAWDDETLAIEEKFAEEAKRFQLFYSYLHQSGYLNKTALAIQRVFQRALEEELREDRLDEDELFHWTDEELEVHLARSPQPVTRQLHQRLMDRTFHRTAVVLKIDEFLYAERVAEKPIACFGMPRDAMRRLIAEYADPRKTTQLESELCRFLGFRETDILFAAMPYFDKLLPKDVRVYSARPGGSYWLFEKDEEHFRALEAAYLSSFAVRLVAVPEIRSEVVRRADDVFAFLKEKSEREQPKS